MSALILAGHDHGDPMTGWETIMFVTLLTIVFGGWLYFMWKAGK